MINTIKSLQEALTYDDVTLVPQYSNIESRSNISLKTKITKNYSIDIPIVASPMDSVVGFDMMVEMFKCGGVAFLPRFESIEHRVRLLHDLSILDFYKNTKKSIIGVTIGVKDSDYNDAVKMLDAGANIILIDIAHGHCLMMKNMLERLTKLKKKYTFDIIGGNVATGDATRDLIEWGCDAIRVGIGGGCFVPGSLVDTENGMVKIEDVNINDNVYTHTGELKKVVGTIGYHVKNVNMVEINKTIKCTSQHMIYVIDNEYIDSEEPMYLKLENYAKWIFAKDISYGKCLVKYVNGVGYEFVSVSNYEKSDYTGKVHDLSVEYDETYNIENYIVHNSRCTTRRMTAHGVPMITSIDECVKVAEEYGVPVMADGGLTNSGDIVKALATGASTVMLGNLLAGSTECPPPIQIDNDGAYVKQYSGSASQSNKMARGEQNKHVEGVSKNVAFKGPVIGVINKLLDGITSGCSYSGAKSIDELYEKSELVRVTNAGLVEANPHH